MPLRPVQAEAKPAAGCGGDAAALASGAESIDYKYDISILVIGTPVREMGLSCGLSFGVSLGAIVWGVIGRH